MKLVLDASVALSWLFSDERTRFSVAALRFVRESGALVPPLWSTEVVQALLKAERRRRVDRDGIATALDLLRALPIHVEPASERPGFSELPLARKFGLSAYDACYLDLAARFGLPLATLDDRLAASAAALGLRWKS